jgi:hypothetical protein
MQPTKILIVEDIFWDEHLFYTQEIVSFFVSIPDSFKD